MGEGSGAGRGRGPGHHSPVARPEPSQTPNAKCADRALAFRHCRPATRPVVCWCHRDPGALGGGRAKPAPGDSGALNSNLRGPCENPSRAYPPIRPRALSKVTCDEALPIAGPASWWYGAVKTRPPSINVAGRRTQVKRQRPKAYRPGAANLKLPHKSGSRLPRCSETAVGSQAVSSPSRFEPGVLGPAFPA